MDEINLLEAVETRPSERGPTQDADALLLAEAVRILRGTQARIDLFLHEVERLRGRGVKG